MGKRIRRDALHFAILYSDQPQWSHDGNFVMPVDGYFMGSNAFGRIGVIKKPCAISGTGF